VIATTVDHSERTNLLLRLSAGGCSAVSLVALVAHIFGVLPMAFFLAIFGVPSLLLLFTLAAIARRINAATFLNCMAVGLAGGFVATLAYDGIRWLFGITHLFQYNGFLAIYIFGSWISGRPTGTAAAAVAGWLYHFWNGLSFGVLYTLAFTRKHWLYGVAYGIVMEILMLGLFPMFLPITNKRDFILMSMLGHIVYGAVLGLIAQRYTRSWRRNYGARKIAR
jgi:hypothetical protein